MRVDNAFKKVKERMEPFLDFQEDEVYVLILLARKKYGSGFLKSSRVIWRHTLTKDDWDVKAMKGLSLMMNYYCEKESISPHDINLYLQVNPRNVRKALRTMKIRMAEHEYDKNYEYAQHLHSLWMSSLQKTSARSRREWFIVDVDSLDKPLVDKALALLPKDVKIYSYLTRKGYHLVTKPFNVQKFFEELGEDRKNVEVKLDDCVLLWCGIWDED